MRRWAFISPLVLVPFFFIAECGKGDSPAQAPDDAAVDAKWPGYDPYAITPASALAAPRGFQLHRGTIHLHSVYSWDAADQKGFIDGQGNQNYDAGKINQPYYDDLRKGLCKTDQEFAFLTDHTAHFPEFEFPDVLLYRPDLGDQLVQENGKPVANKLACPGGNPVLLAAGCDFNALAIGLKQHVADTLDARRMVYGVDTDQSFAALRQNGALVLAGYLPRWDHTQLMSLKFDALEAYNPIFNFQDRLGDALSLILTMKKDPGAVPVPELGLITIFQENTTILGLWAEMAQKSRIPNFLGSNAHENVLPGETWDGERFDSYRRMLHWWTNYVMLPGGTEVTEDAIKNAIAAGRTFGSFDYLGAPSGFDYHAEAGGKTYEMGDQIAPNVSTNLVVTAPTVVGLASIDTPPVVRVRILKAQGTSWMEVAAGSGTVTAMNVQPGVYRAEARITPLHLKPNLGRSPDQYLNEQLWIYANPIWVGTQL
jgi:hypothetical protein